MGSTTFACTDRAQPRANNVTSEKPGRIMFICYRLDRRRIEAIQFIGFRSFAQQREERKKLTKLCEFSRHGSFAPVDRLEGAEHAVELLKLGTLGAPA